MSSAGVLVKEKIISLSQLQKNPSKALDGQIIRITKNGKEIGVFMSKEEFEDFLEESLALKSSFKEELAGAVDTAEKNKNHKKLADIL